MNIIAVKRPLLVRLNGLFRLMRPKQWVKNGFVLAPLVFSGQFLNKTDIQNALLAAFLFCLASSATYVINDIADVESDRRHPKKSKTRPLASGVVSISEASGLLVILYGIIAAGWFASPSVVLVICAYLAISTTYTFILKHQPVLDIFTISSGFVLRVYAGAIALSVPVSGWMFITTLCLALYLAAIKRRQELLRSGTDARKMLEKYTIRLLDRYAEISVTGALVFYSMFVMSSKPQLVISVPLVLFGLFRFWYLVEKQSEGESPTDTLLADWQLFLTVILWVCLCVWALWPARG